MKEDRDEIPALVLICLLVVTIVYAIVDTAYGYEVVPKQTQSVQLYPSIPECDAPLWERIKDRSRACLKE